MIIMAWLQNWAGHAENLLNKIDQNAASVLNESTIISNNELDIFSNDISSSEDPELFDENKFNESLDSVTVSDISHNVSNQEEYTDSMEFGFIDNIAMKRIPFNGISFDENSVEESITSGRMSTSSSIHNSFVLAEESSIVKEKLEVENEQLNKKLVDMQHLYSELRNDNAKLQYHLERANEEVDEARMEKDHYMARAQRILQEKETLISLKQGTDCIIDHDLKNIFDPYIDELKKKLEFNQSKFNELTQKNILLMKQMQSFQMQHQVIQNGLECTNRKLEDTLLNEKKFRAIAEEDYLRKSKEVHQIKSEISQLQELVEMKNMEISKLKQAMTEKVHAHNNDDVESRITSLTQTLMFKQNALETVTTERQALRLQLEKLEKEHKKTLEKLHKSQVQITIEEPDDTILVPKFMRVSPFDAGVTRKVKHAYSTLDAVSIRTGVFLRRYPIARVFVFSYMVLLHFWVIIILCLYVPTNR